MLEQRTVAHRLALLLERHPAVHGVRDEDTPDGVTAREVEHAQRLGVGRATPRAAIPVGYGLPVCGTLVPAGAAAEDG